nr:hypothetical protein SBE_003629 [Streptomyces sp. SBE_14.2]
MTVPAALSGAAVRRALYLTLLVGGLFALGLLTGQRAQAAEDGPKGPTGLAGLTAPTAEVRVSVGRVAEDVGEVLPLPPEGQRLVESVVRPVDEVVRAVTEELDEAREQLPPPPSVTPLPESPEAPELPALPALPDLLDLPAGPAGTLPAPGATEPAPKPQTPARDEPGAASRAKDKRTERPAPRSGPPYDVTVPQASAHLPKPAATPPALAPTPAPHPPADAPDSPPDHQATVDHSTPRHADTTAVTADHRAPLRPAPGTAARAEADGPRDAYRDIPVSPA